MAMNSNGLLKLLKYSECPTCVEIELKSGKRYRKKFSSFTSFLSHIHQSESLKNAEYDDVVVQKSLLDDKNFLMIYGKENGVENGEI